MSRLGLPADVRSGDPITAAGHNAVVRAVEQLLRVRGGGGVEVRLSQAGLVITATDARAGDPMLLGKIAAVNLSGGATPGQPTAAANVTYDVSVYGRSDYPDGTFAGLTPEMGRPVRGEAADPDIWPAEVGDLCRVWIVNDGPDDPAPRLEIVTEQIAFEACDSGGGA